MGYIPHGIVTGWNLRARSPDPAESERNAASIGNPDHRSPFGPRRCFSDLGRERHLQVGPCQYRGVRSGQIALALGAVAILAACGSPKASSGISSTVGSTSTTIATTTTTHPPTLGLATVTRCQGCGQVAPVKVTIAATSGQGYVVPEVDFTNVEWESWGSAQTRGSARAYFVGPGERDQITMYAFDPGACAGSYTYQALEWQLNGQPVDSANYLNVCTGQVVGHGP